MLTTELLCAAPTNCAQCGVPPTGTAPPVTLSVSVSGLSTAVPAAVIPRKPKSMSLSLVTVSGWMMVAVLVDCFAGVTAPANAAGAQSASAAANRRTQNQPIMRLNIEG